MRFVRQYQLTFFFLIALLFSAGMMAYANSTGNEDITMLVPLSPSIIAILVAVFAGGWQGFKALVPDQIRFRFNPIWYVYALLLIPILALIAALIQGYMSGENFSFLDQSLVKIIIVVLLISLGEEFGWRAFALPRLQERFSPLVSSLILGVIWGLWHYPGYLVGVGTPLEMPFYLFMLWVIPGTILITWGYNASGSIIIPILMHASANFAFAFLPLLPEWTGELNTFIILVSILWTAVIIGVVWSMRGQKALSMSS